MSTSPPHVSRLVPPGPIVRRPATDPSADADATLHRVVDGDPRALGRLLADVEPLRRDTDAVVVTDADAEVVRFLAVLAVLEERAPMPEYDLADPSLKWHAPKGVDAVPNPPSIVSAPSRGASPDPSQGDGGAA